MLLGWLIWVQLVTLTVQSNVSMLLQAINSIQIESNNLVDFRKALCSSTLQNNELVSTLQSLFQTLWTEKGVKSKLLSQLKSSSGNALGYKYHSNQHQDINEYIVQLLEYTHQQLKDKENQHSGKENSLVVKEFDGLLTRTRTCPEGHTSRSLETFRILPIQFPHKVRNQFNNILKLTI